MPLRGNDIDTDRIIPARYPQRDHVRRAREARVRGRSQDDGASLRRRRFAGASVLVVNANFGCGSSREHAPQGLQRWGINAIVGESFAEIFFGNSLMIGLPCVTASPADVRKLQDLIERSPDTEMRIDLAAGTCVAGDLR